MWVCPSAQNYNPGQPSDGWTNRRFIPVDVSRKQIESAAKMANAHDFIMRLPHTYDTVVWAFGEEANLSDSVHH
jgi:ABC-type multidrug transport system fused ATPase/permease subunit